MDNQLYTVEWGPPRLWYFDIYNLEEPLDVHPFQVSSLPDALAKEAEQSRLEGDPFVLSDLIDRGIAKVDWRQYPTEILEHHAATTAFFDAMTPLSEGRILPRGKIDIKSVVSNADGYTTYHLVSHSEVEHDPLYFSADLSRTPELADCKDVHEARRRMMSLWEEGTSITVWLPRSLLERPQAMHIGALRSGLFFNQKFVEAWRETDVSRRLREEPWEFDIHFEPFKIMYGHKYDFFDDK